MMVIVNSHGYDGGARTNDAERGVVCGAVKVAINWFEGIAKSVYTGTLAM